MIRFIGGSLLVVCMHGLWAAEPVELSERTFKPEAGIVMFGITWGRTWKCEKYENAQIEALTFRREPLNDSSSPTLELKTPSKLAVSNKFLPQVLVVEPGRYVLTSFDVQVAKSATDVGHLAATEAILVKDGVPTGGWFTVNAGEAVYLGHFGLDCGAEPFLWRYYVQDRKEFEGWVAQFRSKYPFAKQLPAQFRLFETTTLGKPFALADPTVK